MPDEREFIPALFFAENAFFANSLGKARRRRFESDFIAAFSRRFANFQLMQFRINQEFAEATLFKMQL